MTNLSVLSPLLILFLMDLQSGAMRACTNHLHPVVQMAVPILVSPTAPIGANRHALRDDHQTPGGAEYPIASSHAMSDVAKDDQTMEAAVPSTDSQAVTPNRRPAPVIDHFVIASVLQDPAESGPTYDIVYEASKSPLDGAIAASISMCVTESKSKAVASSILLIGGSSALKGLGALLAER